VTHKHKGNDGGRPRTHPWVRVRINRPGIVGTQTLKQNRPRRLLSSFGVIGRRQEFLPPRAADRTEPCRISPFLFAIRNRQVFGHLRGSGGLDMAVGFRGLPLLRNVPAPPQVSLVAHKRHVALVWIENPRFFLDLNKPFR
jgi:hypothetical protein